MKYYLIGIKGSGMSALASLLYDLGNSVIGYDDSDGYKFTMEGLEKRNIKIYHKDEVPKLSKDTIVTYTAAINESHHEIQRLKELGFKIVPYKDIMGYLTAEMQSICVCGTHGKTTTTLMISDIINKTLGCSYFVGDGTGFGNQESDLLVIESCEYNKHFLSYCPHNAIITNIDLDHTETYPTIEDMIETFQEFVYKVDDFVVACGDDENIQKLKIKNGYTYGFNKKNDLVIKNREVVDSQTYFEVYYLGEFYDSYKVNMFGDHLVLDSAAAILTCILYDIPKEIIKDTLESFIPAKRRFNETIIGNNVIVDDYAHHPTEIRATFDSARQKYADKRIIAIFLPNTYSRTEALFNDFVRSLTLFDKAYLMDISCDREKKEDYPNINSGMLVKQIPNSEMIDIKTVNKLKEYDNTVFCFMSCAYISPMVEKAKEVLKNK